MSLSGCDRSLPLYPSRVMPGLSDQTKVNFMARTGRRSSANGAEDMTPDYRIKNSLAGIALFAGVALFALPAAAQLAAAKDARCTAFYNDIAKNLNNSRGRYVTDDEIGWALDYEKATRENYVCPPYPAGSKIPSAPKQNYVPSPNAYQTPAPSRNQPSSGRSGTESCYENGRSGKRYWYYGFDNEKKYGPCV